METFVQDVRYAFRGLRKSPGFTLAAVVTVALGIGANGTIFSAVDALLLRPMQFADGERVLALQGTDVKNGVDDADAAPFEFEAWRRSPHFEAIGGYAPSDGNLGGAGTPERVDAVAATPELFGVLRIAPKVGRTIQAADTVPGSDRVVVLSEDLWRRRFGADPDVVGTRVVWDGLEREVVGVLDRRQAFPPGVDAWIPLALTPAEWAGEGRGRFVQITPLGRLKPDATEAAALASLRAESARLEQERPNTNAGWSVRVMPYRHLYMNDTRPTMFVLIGAVVLVLAIACANVANLLLARASRRRKELAMRVALGASGARIVRQALTESVLLALMGSALGVALADWGVDLVAGTFPPELARDIPGLDELGVNARVVGFSVLLAVVTGLVFGAVPLWVGGRVDLHETLKSARPGTEREGRFRGALVVTEIALALVLLVGTGLMLKSLNKIAGTALGFDPEGVVTARVALSDARHPTPAQRRLFAEQYLERLKALPGVTDATLTSLLPAQGRSMRAFALEGGEATLLAERPVVSMKTVGAGFFAALGIPLLEGRAFGAEDREGGAPVVVVNQAFARRWFPKESALGKQVLLGTENLRHTVVGVVGDVRQNFGRPSEPELYRPFAQQPGGAFAVAVRTAPGQLASVTRALPRELAALDRDQPLYDVYSYERLLQQRLAGRNATAGLLGTFGAVALVLAVLGTYAVMSYVVSQRTHEIGVRMALGAQQRDVLRLVLSRGGRLTLWGLGLGTLLALGSSRAMTTLLVEVSPTDPIVYLGLGVALGAVALLATYVPARRATQVPPMLALRSE